MNSGELYALFRSDVVDDVAPYLWSDTEVYGYMNDAYRMFARLTGGIPDATSAMTKVSIVTGEPYAEVDPSILRFRQVSLRSSGEALTILNEQDVVSVMTTVYGHAIPTITDTSVGPVRYMVVGMERNKVRWLQTPAADDVADLIVYRMPLETIAEGNDAFTFSDIGAEHIEYLALHMKARAYGKQDADAFDKSKRDYYKQLFEEYCARSKAEWERYKHKTRHIAYGGI